MSLSFCQLRTHDWPLCWQEVANPVRFGEWPICRRSFQCSWPLCKIGHLGPHLQMICPKGNCKIIKFHWTEKLWNVGRGTLRVRVTRRNMGTIAKMLREGGEHQTQTCYYFFYHMVKYLLRQIIAKSKMCGWEEFWVLFEIRFVYGIWCNFIWYFPKNSWYKLKMLYMSHEFHGEMMMISLK